MRRAFLLVGLLALPLLTLAAVSGDYARQWPLTLSRDDAGAYRVELTEAMYRQAQHTDLGDIAVLNGDGEAVPAAVFGPDQPLAQQPRRIDLPWFALLPVATGDAMPRGWELRSQMDPDGHLREVEVRILDERVAAAPRRALLLDLSRVRAPVVALELQWQPDTALDMAYAVEASDDLAHWRPLAAHGRMVDLQRDGRRLLRRRIELPDLAHARDVRYLRLTPGDGDRPPSVTAIAAELAADRVAPALKWLEFRGRRDDRDGRTGFEFELDGRFPLQHADVVLPGNHALQWRLESRDHDGEPWRVRAARWMAYRIDSGPRSSRSPALQLSRPVRDRQWRLSAAGPISGEPVLRLGYRPEVLVFLAEGAGDYRVVAGSVRARRADSPLPQLVATLRRQHGPDWDPAPAHAGASRALAGPAALRPARDWKSWSLWAVLVIGALVVAGFAISVLRNGRAPR